MAPPTPTTPISGVATTFDLPNFVGELFAVTPSDTPLLSAIGGLTGGLQAKAKDFEWQGYDLRAPGQNVALEGADAPAGTERARFSFDNVVEVHQEAIEVSYTKQAATGQLSGLSIVGDNPVTDEIGFQTAAKLQEIARDVEFSFIRGSFVRPANNSSARKTRGLIEAIEELPADLSGYDPNVIDAGDAAQTEDMVLDLLQQVWENGGIKVSETATLMTGGYQKRALTKIFVTDKNYQEQSRNVGGVNVQTIETDFGVLNVMLSREVPSDTLLVVSLDELAPVFLEIPGKGFLFVEPLAKTGAAERLQIYGEIGLRYGNPLSHGKIENIDDGVS